MKIRAGYEISYDCPQPTPMILTLSIHPSRFSDLQTSDLVWLDPPIPANTYHDGFGNFCHVIRAPAGRLAVSADFLVQDNGAPDDVAPEAVQHSLETLPVEHLVYLLGSRYCETDRFTEIAWSRFGNVPKGWPLVQAICDYVHDRIRFGYQHASATKTAWDAHTERRGVCRDFAHLAITLCRCMNIPARYCTGYLGDIGVPSNPSPMDFSAWFEVYLGDRWYTFDARHNTPRIGRILIARGRDATDVAIATSFGLCTTRWLQSDHPGGRRPSTPASRQDSRMSEKPVRPLCQRLLKNTSDHQFTPDMHNANTSMEGLTSLNFYRHVAHLASALVRF